MTKQYKYNHVEAAVCLWEAVLSAEAESKGPTPWAQQGVDLLAGYADEVKP